MNKWHIFFLFLSVAVYPQYNNELPQQKATNVNNKPTVPLNAVLDGNYKVNLKLAINNDKIQLASFKKKKDTTEMINAACRLGVAYLIQKDFERSIYYHQYAINLESSRPDYRNLPVYYRRLGIVYFQFGHMNQAIKQFNSALKFATKGTDIYNHILNCIGYTYVKIKDYKKAMPYFQQSVDLALQSDDRRYLKAFYENLAAIQMKVDLQAAKKTLDIGSGVKNSEKKEEINTDYDLQYATYYLKVKDYKLSESYGIKALHHSTKNKIPRQIILANTTLAELKLAQNDLAQARKYAEEAFSVGKNNDNWVLDLKDVTDLLLVIYKKQSDDKKIYEVFKFHTLISDSLSRNNLKEYELRNAFESKAVQDSIKAVNQKKLIAITYNQRIEKQRVLIWSGIICSILLLGMLIFIFKNYRNKQRINKIIAKENDDLTLQKQRIENHVSELLGVVESARDFIAYSKNEPVFSYINNAGKKLLHVNENTNQGYNFADIFDPGTLEFINTAIKISEMNGFSSGEVTVKLNNGSSIPLLLSIVCHRNETGEIDQFSMIGQEISNLKNYQEKIMLQNIMLQKVNRELDRFVYSISHDLRAPLISVVGVLEILENEFYPEDADFQLYLSMLRSGLMNTDDIIRNILSYSLNSRETVKIAEVSISDTIEKTIEQFKEIISRKNINVNVVVHESYPFYSDSQRLQTLFKNVLDNAIKYQRPEEKNKKIDIDFISGEQECILTITDNGIGIENGFEERIFEMFFRGSNLSSGSGLGLYVVKQITDLLEAKIIVNNIPGEKMEFKVVFPNLKSKFRSL